MADDTIDTPEERRNVEALRKAYDAYRRGDARPFFELCAEDVQFGLAASPEHFAYAGVRSGRDWVMHVIAEIGKDFAWEDFQARELIAERDWVIALTGGKIRDRASNALLSADIVDVIRMKDGKVVQFVEYFDTRLLQDRNAAQAAFAKQLKPAMAKPRTTAKAKVKSKRAAAKAPAKKAIAKRKATPATKRTTAKPVAKAKPRRTAKASARTRR